MDMAGSPYLLFDVGGERYALAVCDVERVVLAAEVTPLADAPGTILGLINVGGEVMPVADVRRRLGLPAREMELSDRFIVTRAVGAPLVLLVEAVEGVCELPAQPVAAAGRDGRAAVAAAVGGDGRIVVVRDVGALVAAGDLARLAEGGGRAHA